MRVVGKTEPALEDIAEVVDIAMEAELETFPNMLAPHRLPRSKPTSSRI